MTTQGFTVKFLFDNDGTCTIDAHDKLGNHQLGTEDFTKNMAELLGKIDERHAGGMHVQNKAVIKIVERA